jgi:hypothetical protein
MKSKEALSKMVAPGTPRRGKWRDGVLQIHITRACDLACSNCTQGSQFGGKAPMITVENFEKAVLSLKDYFGVVGIFGGNPAIHPEFETLCEILRAHIPQEQCGLWCNNPLGKGKAMARTFNPGHSNLNTHLSQEAFDEFKRDWPQSFPFGEKKDSHHGPVHISLKDILPDIEKRWELISKCDINQHWSAMIGQFRGELRGYFCEVAGGQAILNQFNKSYPDTGVEVKEGWWRQSMEAFQEQVRYHCHRCSVPLRIPGHLAQEESLTEISKEYKAIGKPKGRHKVTVVEEELVSTPEVRLGKFTHYLQNAE